MKHSLKITLFLVSLFFISQTVGMLIINEYVDREKSAGTGQIVYKELPYNMERPDLPQQSSFIFIIIAVVIGTGILLLLVKFNKIGLWKFWFFLSVLLCMSIAFSAFIDARVAFGLALILAAIKIFKPNFVVHNITEIFIYGGLAAIFVPVMNMFAAIALLVLISIYDMFAVWKSKHMIKLAQFQTSSKLFAGLLIPYSPFSKNQKQENITNTAKKENVKVRLKNAILGGGDIAFPLFFAGVAMKEFGLIRTMVIPLVVTLTLLILLIKGDKNKFYPAMPFLTAGCVIGYLILLFF